MAITLLRDAGRSLGVLNSRYRYFPDFRRGPVGDIDQKANGNEGGKSAMLVLSNILFSALLLSILSLVAVAGSVWVANLLFAL